LDRSFFPGAVELVVELKLAKVGRFARSDDVVIGQEQVFANKKSCTHATWATNACNRAGLLQENFKHRNVAERVFPNDLFNDILQLLPTLPPFYRSRCYRLCGEWISCQKTPQEFCMFAIAEVRDELVD
jgi:hypothetical protein